jgi:hypothetical protein
MVWSGGGVGGVGLMVLVWMGGSIEKSCSRISRKPRDEGHAGYYSALNRSPPPPPLITAFINAKKRSEYSAGGTGLILCYTNTHT